jgi:hypothetical protein
MMDMHNAQLTAYGLLGDEAVAARLGLESEEASRLAVAILVDADLAPELAGDLLKKHALAIEDVKRQESYATAKPVDENGELVLHYQLSETTRRCLRLLTALRRIAGAEQAAERTA